MRDTFIRSDGIHLVPAFEEWQTATMFRTKSIKSNKTTYPLLPLDACERMKYYSSAAFGEKKPEPFRFFKVLRDLEAHDSSSYFQLVTDLPPAYQSFFTGLYSVEYNQFKIAITCFDKVLNSGAADSLLLKETPFWAALSKKMLIEQAQHAAVLAAYTLLDRSPGDSIGLMNLLQQVTLPQYLMHNYVNLFNYSFRKNDYRGARLVYDSIVAHTSYSKLKESLTKNRTAVLEILAGKENFISVMKKGLYHYEVDYLYDHLESWGQDKLTDKEFAETAGFSLHQRSTTKSDSFFTRRLIDTAATELLSKFEVLSFIRTPLDRAGQRFVIVKLGFDNEDTWKRYDSFLAKFKSKPVQQSVLFNKGGISEGNEYMLTKHFIAALYRKDDPVVKYELSLYLLEDAEGNVYAVDTLF